MVWHAMAVSLETKVTSASWISVVTEEARGGAGLSGVGSPVSLGIAGREWVIPWNCPVAIGEVLLLLLARPAPGDVAAPLALRKMSLSAVAKPFHKARPWSESLDQAWAGRRGSPALSWSVG